MATHKLISAALVLGVVTAWISILSTGELRLPITSADGSYYNACCGLISLHGGELRIGNEVVSYIVEQDNGGAYVLPKALVSAANDRLDIDRSAYPLKLRIDRQRGPASIVVTDRSDAPSHSLSRRKIP